MASNPPPQTNAPARPGMLETLGQKHKAVAIGCFVAAAAFLLIPIIRLSMAAHGGEWADALTPVFFWAIACAASCLLVGVGCLNPSTGRRLGEVERMRLMLLILGSSLGILTALLGMTLPFTQGYAAVFTGGAEEWRKGIGFIYIVAVSLLGGLGLAFVSLQLARGVERENAVMRRLLYGFTTAFTTLLLIAVLLLVNLLPYIPNVFNPFYGFMNATYDWTKSRLYTLSDRSHATLAGLKEPIKAYVFLDSNDPIGDETITLLQNMRGLTSKVSWETISSLDRKRIQELFKEYQEKIVQDQPDEFGRAVLRDGVLLVYGEKPKERAVFVPRESLFREQPSPDGGSRQIFTGEAVVLKAIRSLTEGKLTVYFTQGEGELELNAPRKENGLDLIQQGMRQLESYDLKPLTFDGATAEVPKDADVVVVAQAHALKPDALKALGAYMGFEYHEPDGSFSEIPGGGRKGRLFILQGVSLANQKMVHTGLEPLLAKFGVQVGDDRVLSLSRGDPTAVEVQTSPNSPNPVAKAFGPPNQMIFQFDDVRSISPAPAGGSFAVDELVVTAGSRVWVETNLEAKPEDLAVQRLKDPSARFSPTPVSVGVAVSERGAVPNDPFHANVAPPEGGPRMIVVGSSDWIANGGQVNQNGLIANYSLCSSCISWLRGEPDIGAAPQDVDENKVRPRVQLNLSLGGYLATIFLPAAHMALVVAAAACGVWLVRRR